MKRALAALSVLVLGASLGCRAVRREVTWRPDVDDRVGFAEGFLSDSGLLLLCGAVTDVEFMREATARGDEQTLVQRSFTLTLALGNEPGLEGTLEHVDIDSHPSLTMRKGSGACDFEKTRARLFPNETGWVRIGMAWVGNDPVSADRIRTGDLPPPKDGQRATLYTVDRKMGTVALFVGRPTADGPSRNLLLRLGTGPVERLWRGGSSTTDSHREVKVAHWGLYAPTTTIARERTGDGSVAVVDPHAAPVLEQQADDLQVGIGDRLGIQYVASGIRERAVFPVEIQVHHPPIAGQTLTRWKGWAQGGVELYAGWHFQHRCQLVAGAWRFEVHHEGELLAAKEMTVSIAPGQPGTDGCPGL